MSLLTTTAATITIADAPIPAAAPYPFALCRVDARALPPRRRLDLGRAARPRGLTRTRPPGAGVGRLAHRRSQLPPTSRAGRDRPRALCPPPARQRASAWPSRGTCCSSSMGSDLRDGERVSAWYSLWDDVVRGMLPEATSPRTLACGCPLLLFMGYLSAALQEFGPRHIPPGVAIALMAEFDGGPYLFRYAQEVERVWIETTPAGVAQLGGAARLPLPVMPRGDDPAGVFAAFFQAP